MTYALLFKIRHNDCRAKHNVIEVWQLFVIYWNFLTL